MAIPLTYNIRNLIVRRTTTLMTALGIALTVAVLLSVLALEQGLRTSLNASGDPLNILVMRKGAEAELTSNLTRQQFQDLRPMPGIARDAKGDPQVSLELVTVLNLESPEAPQGNNITLRGLTASGLNLRQNLKIAQGRWFQAGQREVVAGKNVAARYPAAQLGATVRFGKGEWKVVGVLDAGDAAANSEIWADLNQAAGDLDRADVLSSALVRAQDASFVNTLVNNLKNDQRLQVTALTEKEYYAAQTAAALPILSLGILVSVIMAVGSAFAAMNTMFAAVSRRAREIGTLRVLGFSQGSILLSFFFESLLLCGLGGIIGILLVLPLNNLTTSVGSFTTFSELAFKFHVTPFVMAVGVGFAFVLGAMGGLFPAASAAGKEILAALREI
jgi:putative ABC transport system permease protein